MKGATVGHSTQRLVPSGLCFDADPIIHCGPNALLAAEVSLRRLDGNVSEQELDLLQFASRNRTPHVRDGGLRRAAD